MAMAVSPPSRYGSAGEAEDHVRALNLQGLDLVSLDGMATMASLEVLNLSGNRLTNFYGIPTHPSMRCLEVNDNRLTSLLGMSHQPSLEVVSMEGNPICAHPEFRLMVLLACGETISIINHRVVTEDERRQAQLLGGSGGWAARCISFGWTDVSPHDRGDDEYQALAEDLKVNYVAMVRCLDRNYSYGAVMARRDPRAESGDHSHRQHQGASSSRRPLAPPARSESASSDNYNPRGALFSSSEPQHQHQQSAASAQRGPSSYSSQQRQPSYERAHQAPSPREAAMSSSSSVHRTNQQLTLHDLQSFYQRTGAPRHVRPTGSAPSGSEPSYQQGQDMSYRGGPAASSTTTTAQRRPQLEERSVGMPQQQSRPHGLSVHQSDAGQPRHYSAVDAARRYASHFKSNGTVVGANVMDVFPGPETGAGVEAAHHTNAHGNASALQQNVSPVGAAALVLMQSEVGCLCGTDIDNVDVSVCDGGTTNVRNALCRVTGAGALHVMDGKHVIYELSLPHAKEVALEKASATVRVIPGVAEGGASMTSQAPFVEIKVREAIGDIETRAQLARGVFKLMMLFKCTPSELQTFYATTLIRN